MLLKQFQPRRDAVLAVSSSDRPCMNRPSSLTVLKWSARLPGGCMRRCRTHGFWLQAKVEAGEDIHLVVWHGVTDNSISPDVAGRGSRSPVRHSPDRQRERVLEFCDHDPGWSAVRGLFGFSH